jgi:ferredoxin
MELRLTSNEVITLNSDESILSALKRAGIYLVASCGGKGACGKCKVNVIEGDFKAVVYGKLTAAEKEAGTVLACQTFPSGDLLIAIPK